jgi:hypothetical protein
MGEFQPTSNPSLFVASLGSKISSAELHFSNSARARKISTPGGEYERHKKKIFPRCGNLWRGIVRNERNFAGGAA